MVFFVYLFLWGGGDFYLCVCVLLLFFVFWGVGVGGGGTCSRVTGICLTPNCCCFLEGVGGGRGCIVEILVVTESLADEEVESLSLHCFHRLGFVLSCVAAKAILLLSFF